MVPTRVLTHFYRGPSRASRSTDSPTPDGPGLLPGRVYPGHHVR